jgi:predicted ATPase
VLAQSRLARVLWLQGFVDQAVRLAADGLARAQALDHKLSICFALSEAVCPIALMSGDLQCADWSVDMLNEIATRHSFHSQMVLGRKFDAQLRVKRGDSAIGLGVLRTASRTLVSSGLTLHYAGLIGDYAEALAANGELSAGLATIDAGLALAETDGVRWHLAELHRVKGELGLRRCEPSSEPVAEACFEQAITVAEFQGALVWQLRAAASLARLRASRGRPRDAHRILAPVYARFTEGFMQADLRAAQSLLATLSVTSQGGATDV